MHSRHHSQVDFMLSSLGATDVASINLDSLSGSAIDLDPGEDHRSRQQDNLDLITPCSTTWGLGGIHSDLEHGSSAYDAPMGDYGPEPTGLGASNHLSQNSASSDDLVGGATFWLVQG